MNKSRIWQIGLGVVLVAAMAIPAVSCSSSPSSATTTSASTTSATTTKTTTSATTTKTTTATSTTTTSSAAKKFIGLDDIPAISNKTTINVALNAGDSADTIIPYIKKFEAKTGVTVTTESMIITDIYPKLNAELLAGTGSYDIIVVETYNTCEWTPYLWKMADLAEKYDPQGKAGLDADLAGHHNAMVRACSDAEGNVIGLPYYTYQQVMFLRQDLIDNAEEKAAFKNRYGYELGVPINQQQIIDLGEFFTRKTGEMLAGKALENDIYGLSIMAGQFEINDEFFTHIYGAGAAYMDTIRDASGKVEKFVITKKDIAVQVQEMKNYKQEIPFSSPDCLTGFWDFATAQFESGFTACLPHMYVSLDQWASGVKEDAGGELQLYPVVDGQGYIGGFHQSIAKASRNPEASYWLARYISSYECQDEMGNKGWSAVRMDVYETPKNMSTDQSSTVYRKMGQRGAVLRKVWDAMEPYIHNYAMFNSDAYGKIYEQQIVILHKTAIGDYSPEDGINLLTSTTEELQNKFGSVPCEVEP